jgi:hypothetical protein
MYKDKMTHLEKFRKAVEGLFDDWEYVENCPYLSKWIDDPNTQRDVYLQYTLEIDKGREGFRDLAPTYDKTFVGYDGSTHENHRKPFLLSFTSAEIDILWEELELRIGNNKRLEHDRSIVAEERAEVFKKFNLPMEGE